MPGGLLTDLYELTMAASYLRRGMEDPATFSLYVRTMPPERGFLVAAGLEPALELLESLSFDDEDLTYLHDELAFDDAAIAGFANLRFDGDVWAVPEGTVVLAGEPILEVTAPMPVAQLVETFLLDQITLQTNIASKAARCRIAADGRELVDFAFRRAPGLDAAEAVARTTAMVGFAATSNVAAARTFGLRAAGTMAHSYIESFPSEAEAFRAFAEDFPTRTTFLVDTYDTPNGVRTAIDVIEELGLRDGLGVRIDSGDLGALAREARAILDAAGLPQVRIVASGGLDELEVARLVRGGAPIDAFGVGTRLAVVPYLDSVYKLVRYADRDVLKLSAAKATLPGPKQVFRGADGDVIGLREEHAPPGTEPLLRAAMQGGRRTRPSPELLDAREHLERGLAALPEAALRLEDPEPPMPSISERLTTAADDARRRALARLAPHDTPSASN